MTEHGPGKSPLGRRAKSSTKKGDQFEAVVHDNLRELIASNKFWAPENRCTIHKKKKYYSRDRNAFIRVDISIEIRLPDEDEYSVLVVVECKDVARSVSVDDIEEFFTKVSQIAGLNTKAIFATRSNFQTGALEFARSKNIAYLRLIDHNSCKWVLKRTTSSSLARVTVDPPVVLAGLISEKTVHRYHDLYAGVGFAYTTTFFGLFQELFASEDQQVINGVTEAHDHDGCIVPFLSKAVIETCAQDVRRDAGEEMLDSTNLVAICEREAGKGSFNVTFSPGRNPLFGNAIGSISFDPVEIWVQSKGSDLSERARFTLAHELGHYFLDHRRHLKSEFSAAEDLLDENMVEISDLGLRRLEWQANHFASCLLMPRSNIENSFSQLIDQLAIPNKGHGALYVDNQACNLNNFYLVTGPLMRQFHVSRQAVTYRLIDLGLIHDDRDTSIGRFLSGAIDHLFREQ